MKEFIFKSYGIKLFNYTIERYTRLAYRCLERADKYFDKVESLEKERNKWLKKLR